MLIDCILLAVRISQFKDFERFLWQMWRGGVLAYWNLDSVMESIVINGIPKTPRHHPLKRGIIHQYLRRDIYEYLNRDQSRNALGAFIAYWKTWKLKNVTARCWKMLIKHGGYFRFCLYAMLLMATSLAPQPLGLFFYSMQDRCVVSIVVFCIALRNLPRFG